MHLPSPEMLVKEERCRGPKHLSSPRRHTAATVHTHTHTLVIKLGFEPLIPQKQNVTFLSNCRRPDAVES